MCDAHCRRDSVASFGFAGLAEADVHARVGERFIGVVIVGEEILLELAFIAVVALRGGRGG